MSKTDSIRVTVTGDLYPDPSLLLSRNLLAEIESILSDSDLVITNLECPLTTATGRIKKSGPYLKANTGSGKLLQAIKVNLVSLANNHLMDFGREGFNDTIDALRALGIPYTGAGRNLAEASQPYVREIRGTRIAVINVTQNEFSIAREDAPGANPIDPINNFYQIERAKAESDHQIVIVHAGIEGYPYPTPGLQKLYRFYASLGVDAVIGHHSHCIGGYEVFNNVPIFYSLGNFMFNEPGNPPSWYEGLLLDLAIGGEGVACQAHYIKLEDNSNDFRIRLLRTGLPEIADPATIGHNWSLYLADRGRRRNTLNCLFRRNLAIRSLNRVFPSLLSRELTASTYGLLRNESSYEYLVGLLDKFRKE